MTIDIVFDTSVFSLDAVKQACYRFIDRFAADIELANGQIICRLTFDDGILPSSVELQIANFRKEVLDQDLRLRLKSETEAVRNLILAHAFSKTGLIADE